MNPIRYSLYLLLLSASVASAAPPSLPGFKLPPGFVVTEFAGDALAHDIYTMTIDGRGRIFVAGRGYIRQLIDDNGDGAADRAIDVADNPKDGAMGLLVEGDTLFAVGDGGLRRFKLGPDGRALGPSEKLVAVKTGGEHTAHAIRRGPDGWLYLICGDGAGIYRPPRAPPGFPVGGYLVRYSPDFRRYEVIADGFRNPFDFDFTADGEPVTFDSDNERCIGLPWYEGCRFYHVVPGHYGWQAPQHTTTWRKPPYFPDVVAPIADLGRGSPTGVACYRHRQFPEKYRGGVFLADWTFGRVWYAPLTIHGATYASKPEPFLESTGDLGLAPTGIAVHPLTGDLYVATGGRGTRGGVYRISYPAGERTGFVTPLLPKKTLPRGHSVQLRGPLEPVRRAQQQAGDIGDPAFRGTVFEGYSSRSEYRQPPSGFLEILRASVPSDDAVTMREYYRLLAMLGDADDRSVEAVAHKLSNRLSPTDDIHYLIVLARLNGRRSAFDTRQSAAVLLDLDRRFESLGLQRDNHWPVRIAELHAELSRKDPNLNRTIVERPGFARPGNAILARAPGFDRKRAAERFLEQASLDPKFAWNEDVIALLDAVPLELRRPWLDRLWERGGFESSLLPVLAIEPREADRSKFADGLRSPQRVVAEACLKGLEALPASKEPGDVLPLVRALRAIDDSKTNAKIRNRLVAQLRRATGRDIGPDRVAWTEWFAKAFPDLAVKLGGSDGVDVAAWSRRFAAIDWTHGDKDRGKVVFERASCATCHSGISTLGPDLRGSGKRLSRDDLLTAIVEPNKDIAPQYRSVLIGTKDGKVHQGLVIYDATDGVMLQTGATTSVRIAGGAIETRGTSDLSLMPTGLLDKLNDAEIRDLIEYLKSLR